MISDESVKPLRETLEGEKKLLLAKIAEYDKPVSFGEEGRVEDFQSEKADEAEEFANQKAIAQAYRDRLEEVENALNKIREGIYGKCEKCGGKMTNNLLIKNPTALICESCSNK